MKKRKSKKITVAVSGGFDPIHVGHVRMFERARSLGDRMVVILNNDNWLHKKKRHIFMPDRERKEVIEALAAVDEVFVTKHPKNPKDMSVSRELKMLRPHIFANGGDRKLDNIPEVPVCEAIGCEMIFNIGDGGKVQSRSWLLGKYVKGGNSKHPARKR